MFYFLVITKIFKCSYDFRNSSFVVGTLLMRLALSSPPLMSPLMGLAAAVIILAVCPPVINAYNITQETKDIAFQLMYAISLMVVFQATQSMLTKGVLRNGGDTRFLMAADIVFMWVVSIPLGWLAGYVWYLSPFWIYVFLKLDYFIKTVWCTIRLKQKTWMHGVAEKSAKEA